MGDMHDRKSDPIEKESHSIPPPPKLLRRDGVMNTKYIPPHRRKNKGKAVQVRKGHPLHACIRSLASFADDDDASSYNLTVALAQSMVDPGTIYRFRLAHYGTISSSVGGVVAEAIVNDPSSWSEWSSLSALFSQVRLRRSTFHLINAFNRAVGTTTSNGNWQPSILNSLYDEVAAPTSYDATCDSPNFKVYNHNFEATKSGINIVLDFKGDHTPLWADVSAPHSSTLFQGTPGCSQVYADGQTVSTVIFSYILVLDLEFMNRF